MNKLSNSVRFSFGVGQMAEGIKNSSFGAFLLFYYNQVLGLSPELAGLAIAISLIFDAVTDPLAGTISDRWHSPLGRRHPFMYASALPLAISFFFLFSPADFVTSSDQTMLFAWMLIFTVLTRGAMTLYHVPHLALGAELSSDYDERTTLVAIRQFLSASGYLLVYGLGFGLFFAPTEVFENGQLNADAYPPFAFCLAVVMFVTIWWSAYGTRSCIPHLPAPSDPLTRVNVKAVVLESLGAMKNRSFLWMMLGFTIVIVAFGVGSAMALYLFTFFWELTRFQVLVVLLTGPAGSLIGYAVATMLFARFDKRNGMMIGAVFWSVLHALPVTLYLLGLVPENGSWALTFLLAVNYTVLGAAVAQIIVGASSAMADIADENELVTGSRQEGVLFGAASFAGKCTTALGSLVAGLVLRLIDWPTGETIKTASDIPEDTLIAMAVISGPVIALIAIPGIICLLGYRLNRTTTAKIQQQLRARAALSS